MLAQKNKQSPELNYIKSVRGTEPWYPRSCCKLLILCKCRCPIKAHSTLPEVSLHTAVILWLLFLILKLPSDIRPQIVTTHRQIPSPAEVHAATRSQSVKKVNQPFTGPTSQPSIDSLGIFCNRPRMGRPLSKAKEGPRSCNCLAQLSAPGAASHGPYKVRRPAAHILDCREGT